MMRKKKLIVNADDFGQSVGINKGIIKAHENGIVTSASLMVRYPSVIEAAVYSKNNTALGVGLHVDLGEWIYRNGNWDPLYKVVNLNNEDAIQKEVNNQLEMFYKIMDRKPTHIDSHQHVHNRKNILPVFMAVAKKLNITLRGSNKKVNYCGDFYGQLKDGTSYHKAISTNGLMNIIEKLPEGITEMACHPALDNDVKTMYRLEREIEVETLCNKKIREIIGHENIELCSFQNISFP